jgi:hypothetical protein
LISGARAEAKECAMQGMIARIDRIRADFIARNLVRNVIWIDPFCRFAQSKLTLFLSILSYRQAWGAETFEGFLKKLRNFARIAPLDVAAVQHIQGLAVTKESHGRR